MSAKKAIVSEVLLEQLAQLRTTADGAMSGVDPEALHDFRIALRRTRTILRELPEPFGEPTAARFSADFKELQDLTSPLRDHDVLIADFDAFVEARPEFAGDAAALRRRLAGGRSAARTRLARRLRSKRFATLLDQWQSAIGTLDGDHVKSASGARITKDFKHFLALGEAAIESRELEQVHHARKRGKRLRYMTEFFGDLNDAEEARRLRRELKKVQDALGGFQDTVVSEQLLRAAAEECATTDAAIVAGAMIERALEQRDEQLAQFAQRFARLDHKKQRKAVKKAFG